MKILIIEDEEKIANIISDFLVKEGFKTKIITDGKFALDEFKKFKPDLLTLDLNLPGVDGITICKKIREISSVPIIMITARVQEQDQLKGLETGAEDYITKPFSPKVLALKIKKMLGVNNTLTINKLVLNRDSRIIKCGGKDLDLTPNEYNILKYMMSNPGKALSRDELIDAMYEFEENYIYDRVIDTHIKNIRKKLKSQSKYIKTVRNFGYKLIEHED